LRKVWKARRPIKIYPDKKKSKKPDDSPYRETPPNSGTPPKFMHFKTNEIEMRVKKK
jgi:hypothetical protein